MADEHQEPGTLIVPHGSDDPKPNNDGTAEPDRPTVDAPASPVARPAAAPEPNNLGSTAQLGASAVANTEAETASGWFHQEAEAVGLQPSELPPEGISWTASEFIAHEKGNSWYLMLGGGSIVVAVLVFLLTHDIISTAVVVFAAVIFGVFAGRKPRTQEYSLTGRGIQIGQKFYGLQNFKTFSVTEDGAIASVVLNPLKRFMPALTIYVAPDLENKVIDFLSAYLPFEQHKADAIDAMLKRIRF